MDDFTRPEGLSDAGCAAYRCIMQVLEAEGVTHTGGCKTFYSPAEWAARGERYGTDAVLIVAYDGSAVGPYFGLNKDADARYVRYERMRKALSSLGLCAEECTGWYTAVYKINKTSAAGIDTLFLDRVLQLCRHAHSGFHISLSAAGVHEADRQALCEYLIAAGGVSTSTLYRYGDASRPPRVITEATLAVGRIELRAQYSRAPTDKELQDAGGAAHHDHEMYTFRTSRL